MPDYQQGKIYSIRSVSRPDLVYVGSTVQPLSKRFGRHKTPANHTTSKQVIDIGDAYIELIEMYPCDNIEQLRQREGEIMRSMDCVNKNAIRFDCPHKPGRKSDACGQCGGSQVCVHGKRKYSCKLCDGSQVCIHGRYRSKCKECNGGSICIHGKQRCRCKTCTPVECSVCNVVCSGKTGLISHMRSIKHLEATIAERDYILANYS